MVCAHPTQGSVRGTVSTQATLLRYTAICVLRITSFALKLVLVTFIAWFIVAALGMVIAVQSDLVSPIQGYKLIVDDLAATVPLVLWFWYFKVSKRVRDTFGRNM